MALLLTLLPTIIVFSETRLITGNSRHLRLQLRSFSEPRIMPFGRQNTIEN